MLYNNDERTIRRIVVDAGLDPTRIDLKGSAINMWAAVLQEARHTQNMEQLIAIVLKEYRNNPQLHEAVDAYHTDIGTGINNQ